MKQLPEHVKGLAITVTGVLVLSPDSLLVRLIATDPWTMVFWRGVLTALGLVIWLALFYRAETLARMRAIGRSGLAVSLLLAGSSIHFVLALSHTSVANTLVIIAASPLITAVFCQLFLGEAVRPRTWAAILTALAGILILASDSLGAGTLGGDLAALATAGFLAGAYTIIRAGRTRNMVPAMALSGIWSALVVLPLASPLVLDPGQTRLMLLLGLGVLPISFGLITLGPRYLPAPEVGLIMLLETVLGPLWVWLVIDEQPSVRALIGGAVVIGALALHSIVSLRRTARA